jgi:hypothetical protein
MSEDFIVVAAFGAMIMFAAGVFSGDYINRRSAERWCIEKTETKEQALKCSELKFPWEK